MVTHSLGHSRESTCGINMKMSEKPPKMKYILNPSLQHLTLVKISADLWNHDDIRTSIKELIFPKINISVTKEWQKIQNKVSKKVTNLPLPRPLKRHLLCIVRPIGHQIKSWCLYHLSEECRLLKLPQQFYWTAEGTIDRKRTAETMLKDEDIDVESRYKLSCIYCLVDEILELWNRIEDVNKSQFFMEENAVKMASHSLVEFWTHHLFGKKSGLDSIILLNMKEIHPPHVYAFHCAVNDANKMATEFFFSKLSDEERDTLLVDYAKKAGLKRYLSMQHKEYFSEVFHFLLSKMNEEQQEVGLDHDGLLCFLDWPFQPFYLDCIKRVWDLGPFPYHVYSNKLDSILDKIVEGWTDFDYRRLFNDVWNATPLRYRKSAINGMYSSTLSDLLEAGKVEIVKKMFVEAESKQKKKFILSKHTRNTCVRLVFEGHLRKLTPLVELWPSFIEDMDKFKKDFEGYFPYFSSGAKKGARGRWEKFVGFLDELAMRKCEEDLRKLIVY